MPKALQWREQARLYVCIGSIKKYVLLIFSNISETFLQSQGKIFNALKHRVRSGKTGVLPLNQDLTQPLKRC
jgi:hypothetical protein